MVTKKLIIIIGGGASGFFAAINAAINFPEAKIIILEKSNKILSKVRVSGGGRCNVTHQCFENNELIKNYPRGEKELRQVFAQFSVQDTIDWFLKHSQTENGSVETSAGGAVENLSIEFLRDFDLRSFQRAPEHVEESQLYHKLTKNQDELANLERALEPQIRGIMRGVISERKIYEEQRVSQRLFDEQKMFDEYRLTLDRRKEVGCLRWRLRRYA